MKVDCIIPVGPGHEDLHLQAVESVRIASLLKGSFTDINIRIIDDTKGQLGRSKARNIAVEGSDSDWIFFLDADDRIHPEAFSVMSGYLGYDAVWGNVLEIMDGICVWRYQVPHINTYRELLSFDPYKTIGPMGHFVKTEVAKKLPFNEEMDCGEDWDFYLREWKDYTCIKQKKPFIINYRQEHSTGPRSATGRDWMNVVHPMLDKARYELESQDLIEKDGYWFPKTDQHFSKGIFELYQIQNCLIHCKGLRNAIDVGAHVGSWTKELASMFSHVLAYEPEPANYRCLAKNTDGLDNVKIFNLAVGDSAGSVHIVNDDWSNSGAGWVADGGSTEMITLDSHIEGIDEIDFIKIDVEGYEPNVLIGAEQVIKNNKPAILLEMKQQTARFGKDYLAAGKLLEDWGYHLVEQMNKNYLYVVE